jgi:phytoene synthase
MTDAALESALPSLAEAERDVTALVADAGTSFALGMRILPRERRLAMYGIYAFCRAVDDIADGIDSAERKRAGLDLWRMKIDAMADGEARCPITLVLAEAHRRFRLPRGELHAVIDGMAMDLDAAMIVPSEVDLMLYCRRVAGAVGLLSLPIFGAHEPAAPAFAVALGNALQLTNILRDIGEDGARGRLYLPRERLTAVGIDPDAEIAQILLHPRIGEVCESLAREAQRWFNEADRVLLDCDRSTLRPALLMGGVYALTLAMLNRRGWDRPADRLPMSKAQKLRGAIFHGLFRPAWRPFT